VAAGTGACVNYSLNSYTTTAESGVRPARTSHTSGAHPRSPTPLQANTRVHLPHIERTHRARHYQNARALCEQHHHVLLHRALIELRSANRNVGRHCRQTNHLPSYDRSCTASVAACCAFVCSQSSSQVVLFPTLLSRLHSSLFDRSAFVFYTVLQFTVFGDRNKYYYY